MNRIQILKDHLMRFKINHVKHIMKEPTFKDAHIYCVINNVASQQYGCLLERYLISKYNYRKNRPSDCIGDCAKYSRNIELKVSLGGKSHKNFNYVQIRVSHDIGHYILTAYHLTDENVESEGDLYLFRVPKSSMKEMILSYGGYAHGTKKELGRIMLNDEKSMMEYVIRPSYGDACWKALLKFRILEADL